MVRFLTMFVVHLMGWLPHHLEHVYTTCSNKSDHKDSCQYEKDDIENTGIIPLCPLSDRDQRAIFRNNPQCFKQKLDHITSSSHGNIKRHQDITHHFPAIVLAVDVKNREYY